MKKTKKKYDPKLVCIVDTYPRKCWAIQCGLVYIRLTSNFFEGFRFSTELTDCIFFSPTQIKRRLMEARASVKNACKHYPHLTPTLLPVKLKEFVLQGEFIEQSKAAKICSAQMKD